jgi:type I site-specific restriction endonuclease
MMTTGYDCPDILNLGLFRPIFSPTDFIQIKGRGTRKHDFREQLFDETIRLALIDRPEDLRVRLFATGGVFQFWERLRKTLVTHSTGNDFPEQQSLIEYRQ